MCLINDSCQNAFDKIQSLNLTPPLFSLCSQFKYDSHVLVHYLPLPHSLLELLYLHIHVMTVAPRQARLQF